MEQSLKIYEKISPRNSNSNSLYFFKNLIDEFLPIIPISTFVSPNPVELFYITKYIELLSVILKYYTLSY